jgi:hypothetical protein
LASGWDGRFGVRASRRFTALSQRELLMVNLSRGAVGRTVPNNRWERNRGTRNQESGRLRPQPPGMRRVNNYPAHNGRQVAGGYSEPSVSFRLRRRVQNPSSTGRSGNDGRSPKEPLEAGSPRLLLPDLSKTDNPFKAFPRRGNPLFGLHANCFEQHTFNNGPFQGFRQVPKFRNHPSIRQYPKHPASATESLDDARISPRCCRT